MVEWKPTDPGVGPSRTSWSGSREKTREIVIHSRPIVKDGKERKDAWYAGISVTNQILKTAGWNPEVICSWAYDPDINLIRIFLHPDGRKWNQSGKNRKVLRFEINPKNAQQFLALEATDWEVINDEIHISVGGHPKEENELWSNGHQ